MTRPPGPRPERSRSRSPHRQGRECCSCCESARRIKELEEKIKTLEERNAKEVKKREKVQKQLEIVQETLSGYEVESSIKPEGGDDTERDNDTQYPFTNNKRRTNFDGFSVKYKIFSKLCVDH